jgi:TPR repeat protein
VPVRRKRLAHSSPTRAFARAKVLAYRTNEPLWWANLAAFYATGDGTRKNLSRARRWYLKAATAGEPCAMYELGFMYLNGEGGPRYLLRGRKLVAAAARAGEINALKALSQAFAHGAWGFPRSVKRAAATRTQLRRVMRAVEGPANNALQRTRYARR